MYVFRKTCFLENTFPFPQEGVQVFVILGNAATLRAGSQFCPFSSPDDEGKGLHSLGRNDRQPHGAAVVAPARQRVLVVC